MVGDFDEDMSEDEDPRTGTQLVNNESLAQCSQDSEPNLHSSSMTGSVRQSDAG